MPLYNDLRHSTDADRDEFALIFSDLDDPQRARTIENLLRLRDGLRATVAAKRADHNLLVASWNIKEFGHTTQRRPEAFFYIAEILAAFDLIAIQEVKSTLEDLYVVMKLLGDHWDYVINDVTGGTDGNSERSAYLFNRDRVRFAGLAGEIVLWEELTANSPVKQLKRTPYITGFEAGWKTFALVNLHLHPGDDDDDIVRRRAEAQLLLQALAKKVSRQELWNENLILVGDFNFYVGADKDDPTVAAIEAGGFNEVDRLKGVDTNASQTETYDRMFLTSGEYFALGEPLADRPSVAGVFRPFDFVYRAEDIGAYRDYMVKDYTGNKDMNVQSNLESYYRHPWRKNQLSDHFPIWVELVIDSSDEFLGNRLDDFGGGPA